MMNIILQDKDFLKLLLENRNRTVYVRITALDLHMQEIDMIMGKPTDGSINIDGASAVRRSCNLTLMTDRVDINDYHWALNTRFRLEIGVKNNTNKYPTTPIVWFPQGVYIITQFSVALNGTGSTISLSGQDKMCLLNGEVSGHLVAETDFGKYEEIDANGQLITHDLTLREIITALVHTYAFEPLENIEIELPDDSGYNLLTYRGDNPLYILRGEDQKVENYTLYGHTLCEVVPAAAPEAPESGDEVATVEVDGEVSTPETSAPDIKILATLGNYWSPKGIDAENNNLGTQIKFINTEDKYYVQKVEYGEQAGYEETPLTFAGELIAAAGEAATSILDKIKNMLGEFEYGYNLNGKFFFRKKKTYLKSYMNDQSALMAFVEGEYSYKFEDLSMFTSFNNNPDIKNLKNDFTVWGEYKTASGAALPIHMRVAIDSKPTKYVSYWQGITYYTATGTSTDTVKYGMDWRELIYQMAMDYQAHHIEYDYAEVLEFSNPHFVKNGRTGYEQYYTDILGFWRLLYEPNRNNAISSWYRTSANNLSLDRYYYTWQPLSSAMIDFTSEVYRQTPYTHWYVNQISGNGTYKVSWMDSVDLSPSNLATYYDKESGFDFGNETSPSSLRTLYRYNETAQYYSPIMRQSLGEAVYYVYERSDYTDEANPENNKYGYLNPEGSLVNLAQSATWGIMDNLDKLYLKKVGDTTSEPIPLRLETPANALPGSFVQGVYKPGIYYSSSNMGSMALDSMIYYLSTESSAHIIEGIDWGTPAHCASVKQAFKDPKATIVLYNKTNDDSDPTQKVVFNSSSMRAYAVSRRPLDIYEGYQYALYIKKPDKTLQLYANYLMTEGVKTTVNGEERNQVLDEKWLSVTNSTTKTFTPLMNTISFERSNLYRQFNSGGYYSVFENTELLTNLNEMYYIGTETAEIEAGMAASLEYEEYYSTDLLTGAAETSKPRLQRPIDYWTYKTDYNLDTFWLKAKDESPQTLLFWFNFLDPAEYPDLEPYSVQSVGIRSLVKKEKDVKAIFYPKTPDIYFGEACPLTNQSKQYFTISSQGQSAHDVIDQWLYNHTYITESVSVNSIPLYHLEPNTKVYIKDEERGIDGDYIVDKMTIPLSYSGTMSITATKAPETF